MPTKPSYSKLSVLAVSEGCTNEIEVGSFIAEKYSKCSMKCLQKAIAKNLAKGIMNQVTQAGVVRLDLSDEKKRSLRRKKKKMDPNRSRKPLTGYNVYVRERISSRVNLSQPITELMKEIARQWMSMETSQKETYNVMAQEANVLRG